MRQDLISFFVIERENEMKTLKNRYAILFVAAIANFVHGNPYVWTVFQPYVKEEFGISLAQSSQPFMFIIAVFAIGNMIGGYLEHRIGARMTILSGSAFMCLGFFLAAIAPYDMPWLVSVGYGIMGGIGSGCAFSMLVAIPQAWFPDKRGMVTGITVGVVGAAGVIMNPICDFVLAAKGYRFSMLMITIIYGLLSLGGLFIDMPKDVKKEVEEMGRSYSTKEIFKMRPFYLICISMALAVPAYVLVNPLMKSLGMERGLTGAQALAGVLIANLVNIFGRFVAAWATDKIGARVVIEIMYAITMGSVLCMIFARGALFVLASTLISMTYGGYCSVFPAMTAQYFGMKYQGMNYGAVMIGYGIVSVLCPYLLDFTEKTSMGISLSFLVAGVICLIGMVVTAFIRKEQVTLSTGKQKTKY